MENWWDKYEHCEKCPLWVDMGSDNIDRYDNISYKCYYIDKWEKTKHIKKGTLAAIRRDWKACEKEIGRKVTEDEAWKCKNGIAKKNKRFLKGMKNNVCLYFKKIRFFK